MSKALTGLPGEHLSRLEGAGLLVRDPRAVERKKPGQKKARKKFAWSVAIHHEPHVYDCPHRVQGEEVKCVSVIRCMFRILWLDPRMRVHYVIESGGSYTQRWA